MGTSNFFTLTNCRTSIIAVALHDGHDIDEPLRKYLLLDEQQRAREEDPYTGYMIAALPVSKLIVHSSRFQLDLNRTQEQSVYENPEDAWGLEVWKGLPKTQVAALYDRYHACYAAIQTVIEEAIHEHGYFLILDIHSYNHRRENAQEQAPAATHPEINIGTAYNKAKWSALCEGLTDFLAASELLDHPLDVRQNIIFKGGAFAQWVADRYGDYGPVFSIEFKKTFMDEWTGIADVSHLNQLQQLLGMAVDFLYQQIQSKTIAAV